MPAERNSPLANQRQRQSSNRQPANPDADESENADVLSILAGIGAGIAVGTLVLKAAESSAKSDVAAEMADALRQAVDA